MILTVGVGISSGIVRTSECRIVINYVGKKNLIAVIEAANKIGEMIWNIKTAGKKMICTRQSI
jgi:hypothetical protein